MIPFAASLSRRPVTLPPMRDNATWKTLLQCDKNREAIARTLRANVDVALTPYRNRSWAA